MRKRAGCSRRILSFSTFASGRFTLVGMSSSFSKSTLCTVLFASAVFGCGSESPKRAVPWAEQRTLVIDASRNPVEVEPVSGTACLMYEGECLKPHEQCGEEGADILLDADGNLLDYVCYPGESTLTVEEIEAREGDVAQNENNAVIVLDDEDDGADIDGDLSIDANNVVLYAEDPTTAIVSGSVTVDGNNILVRGVGIEGDLTVVKNDVTIALSIVHGNVVIQGNNVALLASDVLGNVTVTGNNLRLLGSHIAGTLSITGNGAECRDNLTAIDTNGDGVFAETELGAPLLCD